MPGLGRLPQWDSRNLGFVLRATRPGLRRTITWPIWTKALNQDDTGTCVAFAATHRLLAVPVRRILSTLLHPYRLYEQITTRDPWHGGLPDTTLQDGTSALAAMQTLLALGLIERYEWALTVEQVIDFVCSDGPVMLGTDWYSGMFDPEGPEYVLKPTGQKVGGHEYVLIGWNERRGLFRVLNSWGPKWAYRGRAWIEPETVTRFLRDGGDAVSPTELRAA